MKHACIRSIQAKDASAVSSLLTQLGYPLSDAAVQDRIRAYSTPPLYAFVYERDDQVVGVIALTCYDLFISRNKRARIEALVVDEPFRRFGIGQALLQYVEAVAQEKGARIIDLTSAVHREKTGAHAFYQKNGYGNSEPMQKVYLQKDLESQK